MVKNSINNPLHIDSVTVPGTSGLIGMTLCPGRKYLGRTGVHDRDLDLDLEVIHNWGATMLVSLIEEHEYSHVPDSAWEAQWNDKGTIVRSALRNGDRICVHCMGGLGRTGLFTARLLVEFGMSPDEAILTVRQARPGTIETPAQEDYVRSCPAVRGPVGDKPRQACIYARPFQTQRLTGTGLGVQSQSLDFINPSAWLLTRWHIPTVLSA